MKLSLFLLSLLGFLLITFYTPPEANALDCKTKIVRTGQGNSTSIACNSAESYLMDTKHCTDVSNWPASSCNSTTQGCSCTLTGTGCDPKWTCAATQCTNRSSSSSDSTCTYFGGTVTCGASQGFCSYTTTVDNDSRCGSTCPGGSGGGGGGGSCSGPTTYACTGSQTTSKCTQYTYAIRNGVCGSGAHDTVADSFCGTDCCSGPTTYRCGGTGGNSCVQYTWATRSGVCASGAHASGQAQSLCCASGSVCNNGACAAPTPNCNSGITCGACSLTCGSGTKSCTYTTHTSGGACNQVAAPSQSCGTAPINGGWSAWSTCSATCGGGTQTRTCNNPTPNSCGTACSGSTSQACNTQACAPTTFNITGNVYVDTNRNGVKDTGEANQNATTVNLSGASSASTATNTSGVFTFSNRNSGNYTVTLTAPSGYSATTTNPRSVTVGPNSTVNFGIALVPTPTPTRTPTPQPPTPTPAPQTYNITGNVYVDANRNGVKDTGEINQTGTTVNLSGASSASTTTNTSGVYSFNNRAAGNYNVTLTAPAGYSTTTTNPVARTLGPTTTVNFGIAQNPTPTPTRTPTPTPTNAPTNTPTPTPTAAPSTFTVTGNVYVDTNRNGSKDTGETNQTGATVTCSGTGGSTTNTNTSGNFTCANLASGNHNVTLTVPAGFSATTTNPRAITVGPNSTVNFGIALVPTPTPTSSPLTPTPTPFPTSSITITVYDDNNANGVRDTGEATHPGVSLTVTGQGAGNYTTNGGGQVVLPAVINGNSTITMAVPANYTATTANPRTITTPPNSTVNFGVQPPAPSCTGGLVASPTTVVPGGTSTLTATGCSGTGTLTYTYFDDSSVAGDSVTNNNTNSSTWTAPNPFASTVTAHPSVSVCLTGNVVCTPYSTNVLIAPKFVIQGNVFLDGNKDTLKNSGEGNYSGTITISSGGSGTVSYPSTGAFRVSNLNAGTYTISYSGLPSGYTLTYPLNGPPPSFTVTVGASCSGSGNSATCDAGGNINNLNYGITNSNPWIQAIGGDITGSGVSNQSGGGFTDQIPAGASCGSYASIQGAGGTPGIIFSGGGSANFGSGQASANPYNWVVGGLTYPNVYVPSTAGIIKTSYSYIDSVANQANLTENNLASVQGCSNLANCQLPANLGNGIYKANGSVTLTNSGYTFPVNKNFVILVNGDLTIKTQIHVPVGSTLLFTVSGNIYVDQSVGEAVITSTNPNLEGYYSTDKSFYAQGTNVCPTSDLRLNVAGAIVVNAALGGGAFVNERDLCAGDNQCPVFSIAERPDFVLYSPNFLQNVRRVWQEIAP